jgi:hypothetical protein
MLSGSPSRASSGVCARRSWCDPSGAWRRRRRRVGGTRGGRRLLTTVVARRSVDGAGQRSDGQFDARGQPRAELFPAPPVDPDLPPPSAVTRSLHTHVIACAARVTPLAPARHESWRTRPRARASGSSPTAIGHAVSFATRRSLACRLSCSWLRDGPSSLRRQEEHYPNSCIGPLRANPRRRHRGLKHDLSVTVRTTKRSESDRPLFLWTSLASRLPQSVGLEVPPDGHRCLAPP